MFKACRTFSQSEKGNPAHSLNESPVALGEGGVSGWLVWGKGRDREANGSILASTHQGTGSSPALSN